MIIATIAALLLVAAMGWALVHHGKCLDKLDETSDPAPHPDADESEWRAWEARQLEERRRG